MPPVQIRPTQKKAARRATPPRSYPAEDRIPVDVRMPDMDVLQATRLIRQSPATEIEWRRPFGTVVLIYPELNRRRIHITLSWKKPPSIAELKKLPRLGQSVFRIICGSA